MKKLFTCIVVAVITSTSITAQEIKIGAKAGLNLSSIGGDEIPGADYKSKLGLHLGGVGIYMFSDEFGVQAELLYSSFGNKTEESGDFGSGGSFSSESTTKRNYLSLPLMGKYYVSDEISIEAGPRIGFLLSANTDFESVATSDGETETTSGTTDISEFTNGIDLGFNLGASYEMENNVFFSLRYTAGLSNINATAGDFTSKNNALQFSIGYFFLND